MRLLLATTLTLLSVLTARSSAKVIDTLYGQVDGNTVTLDDGSVVHSWYGIPYAKPPVRDLRFELPRKPEPWSGVFQAKKLPPACYQSVPGLIWLTHPGHANVREDCLNINVYAPDNLEDAPLAVMVWFHGGGYISGANIQYPGHFLAAKGVIVAIPNYRLNSFGFLATPDGSVRGNMGLYDQNLALQWVQENIAQFGGDPKRVTIFGQSAGASSSSLHMISPHSQGLFSQAIMQSGAESNLWSLNYPGQEPEKYVYQLATKTECLRDTDDEMIACLKRLPAIVIRRNQGFECAPGHFCQGYAPIIDGPGGFIPKQPLDLRRELPAEQVVPSMGGICSDDGSLYAYFFIPEGNQGGFNSTMFNYYMRTRLIDIFAASLISSPEQYEIVFNAFRWFYVNWPYLEDGEANREAFNKMVTDGAFGYSWDRQMKLIAEKNPNVYSFVHSFRSVNASTFIPEWMGVPHTGEVPYVFGLSKLINNPAVREDSGIFFDALGYTQEDAIYADYQITLWTNFAKYGNPTPKPVKAPLDDTLTTWDKFSMDDDLKVFNLGREITTEKNFRQQRNAFYYDYLSTLAGKPLLFDEPEHNHANFESKVRFRSDQVEKATIRFVEELLAKRGIFYPTPLGH